MAFTQLTDDLAIIAALSDLPNDTDGLTAAQLKAKFDEAAGLIKTYINDTLLDEIASVTDGSSGADNIGSTAIAGVTGTTVQAQLESLASLLDTEEAALVTHKSSNDHDGRYFTETELGATTDSASGADKIGSTAISGVTGATVQAQLESLASLLDTEEAALVTHKTSSDHDGRYFTETELGATTDSASGADKIGSTAIEGVTGATVQAQLEDLASMGLKDLNVYALAAISAGDMVGVYNDNEYAAATEDITVSSSGDCGWSPDGEYVAVTVVSSPYLKILKRKGDDFEALSNPATMPGSCFCPTFSPCGTYLAIGLTSSPYLYIYKRDGDTFTKLDNPASLPSAGMQVTEWSPDGRYLAVGGGTGGSLLAIYERDGDTFTKLSDPADMPPGAVNGMSFSSDGKYLAIAHGNSPYILIYKRNVSTFTKLATVDSMPGTSYCIKFSPDGDYLAVGSSSGQHAYVYKRTGDSFSLINHGYPGDVYGNGSTKACDWSPDGDYVYFGSDNDPWLQIYKRTGDYFYLTGNPSSTATNDIDFLRISPDGRYLAYCFNDGDYFHIKIISKAATRQAIPIPGDIPKDVAEYGIAKTSAAAEALVKVRVLFIQNRN